MTMVLLHLLLISQLVFINGDSCSIPPAYAHKTSHTEGGLVYKFAMDQSVYTTNDTIRFYYVVENVGPDTVSISFSADPQNAFVIYPDTCYSLKQQGCLDAAIYFYPQIIYYYPLPFNLAPGECNVYSMSWNQEQNTWNEPGPGSYHAFGGLWKTDPEWPGQWVGPSGLMLHIVIEETQTRTRTETWGHIKSIYRR
jgi:hypothetical protein